MKNSCKECDHCRKSTYKDISQVTETYYDCDLHEFEIGMIANKTTCDDNTADIKRDKINFRRI